MNIQPKSTGHACHSDYSDNCNTTHFNLHAWVDKFDVKWHGDCHAHNNYYYKRRVWPLSFATRRLNYFY